MHARSISTKETMTTNEKCMIKDMKRDLFRFVPLLNRMTKRKTKEFDRTELHNISVECAKTYDHMIPTISFRNKCNDSTQKSISDFKKRAYTSQSTERVGRPKTLISKEDQNYSAEKLVYPSVRKLKNMMANCEETSGREVKTLKRILFDHINKNMKHMNLRISKEIEAPSVTEMSNHVYHMKFPEVRNLENDFIQIKVNHKKNGIMRRNGLLLEHIIRERIKQNEIYQIPLPFYRTNISTMA